MDTPPSPTSSLDHARAALKRASAGLEPADIQGLRVALQAAVGGEYIVGESLGQGGMGAVFRAQQTTLDRPVAIKVLLPSGDVPREEWVERFRRESKALASLSHPGIVAVHGYGESDSLVWIVMEAVDGSNLRELLRDGDLSPDEALSIAPQICRALQYAHDHGVVHRDVKPENVLLDASGQVKLVDFGLAKLDPEIQNIQATAGSQVLGTFRYMAPEQLDAPRTVDHRADIFSLGVVLYEMLTGQIPQGTFEPPSKRVPVDERVDEVVARSLEREPERRYQLASDVATRVDEIRSGSDSAGTDTSVGAAAPSEQDASEDPLSQARLRQHRLGGWLDSGVVLTGLAILGTGGPLVASELSAWSWLLTLGTAYMAGLALPGFVGSFIEPKRSTVHMPFLRVASAALALGATLLVAPPVPMADMSGTGRALLRNLVQILQVVALLPLVSAAFSAVCPTGFQWGTVGLAVLRWLGGGCVLLVLASAAAPWGEGYSVLQVLLLVFFAVILFYVLTTSKYHMPYKMHKVRSVLLASGGPVGVLLILMAARSAGVDPRPLAIAAAVATGLVGGLLGAGTHLLSLDKASSWKSY